MHVVGVKVACMWTQYTVYLRYHFPSVLRPLHTALIASQKPITCPSLLFLVVPRESNPTVGIA